MKQFLFLLLLLSFHSPISSAADPLDAFIGAYESISLHPQFTCDNTLTFFKGDEGFAGEFCTQGVHRPICTVTNLQIGKFKLPGGRIRSVEKRWPFIIERLVEKRPNLPGYIVMYERQLKFYVPTEHAPEHKIIMVERHYGGTYNMCSFYPVSKP